MKEILDAAHDILKRSNISAEEIAEQAFGLDENGNPRKSHWTLYKELNPNDTTAKLGAIDLFLLMRATNDIEPLRVQARKLGYILMPVSAINPDKSTWQEEHVQDSGCFGEMARLMCEGKNPDEVEKAMQRLEKELLETFEQYRRECTEEK